jgi:hypothetical protein
MYLPRITGLARWVSYAQARQFPEIAALTDLQRRAS